MNPKRLLVAIPGLVAFAAAVVVLLDPASAGALPVDAVVDALGFDYLLVAIVGAVALVVTLLVLALRAVGGLDQADPPSPEDIETVPRLGSDLDDVIENGVGIRARLFDDDQRRVRERLRETAIVTVMRVSDCSRAEARERVATGAWTTDAEAASFLTDRGDEHGSWRTRLLATLTGQTPFHRGVRRSAEAIVAYAEDGDGLTTRRRSADSGSTAGGAGEPRRAAREASG